MAPEYGATCGIFPVDAETLNYLRLTGRSEEHIALVEDYFQASRASSTPPTPPKPSTPPTSRSTSPPLSPASPAPSARRTAFCSRRQPPASPRNCPPLLGPNGNQDAARQLVRWEAEGGHASGNGNVTSSKGAPDGQDSHTPAPTSVKARFGVDPDPYLGHGSIVIAAITSCTNTSNPYVMVAAGLLAKKAVERGLHTPPWVKTSLAPGSRVVTDYYNKSGLTQYLDALRFQTVGYGCTTCIGNSGPLPTDVIKAIEDHSLVAVCVLSGNRNFEGRISAEVRANYLMSPPLVVAYALAGHIGHDFDSDPLGKDQPASPSTCGHLALANRGRRRPSPSASTPRCSATNTRRSPRATPTGSTSSSPPAIPTAGSPTPPTSARPRTSTA